MKKTALVVALLLGSHALWADEVKQDIPATAPTPANFVGGMGGLGIVTSGGSGNFGTFSGELGVGILRSPALIAQLGIYAGHANDKSSTPFTVNGAPATLNLDVNYTVVAGEISIRRIATTQLYFGTRLGATFLSTDLTMNGSVSTSGSGTSLFVAPFLGYDLPVTREISIPLDISWASVSAGNLKFANVGSVHYDAIMTVLLQAGLHFNW